MLFHRIHSPLVTCFSSSFNLFQFQVLRPFYGVLLKHGSNIMNPGHFVLCLGGEPHNSTTLQHRLHVLRNWNWSSCRGLEIPCTAHQVCWKHQKSLATVVVAQCLPWRRWPRFQAVLVTVSHCKMQFCRFSVFPLQQACQRLSVYLHSSFCDFFWIYTLRLNLPIQISSILDGSLFMFSGLRVCSWSVLRTLFHHCLMFHNWGRF